ncbi:MAG TPA: NADH-quinone oxidoreductase subunit NuoE [Alphaproteobacteria bacterium]|jgi:NADH-quinone oxidoreductase subunit E|nr:NADH-quinone oxidoreductase subunit NuoE [Alphaproteobacteria bacterium]
MSACVSIKSFEQPKSFTFSDENLKKIEQIIAKYPKGKQQSAIMPLLDLAQRQNDNWIPEAAMEEIARILDVARIKVFEVATFYTMYNLQPRGKHHLQFCTTTPCWLRGSADVVKACEKHLGIKLGETTEDGMFTMTDVECLGACVNAPVVQRNGDEYYEDLTPENVIEVLENLKAGKIPQHGTQAGRTKSMSTAGTTTLLEQAEKSGVSVAVEGKDTTGKKGKK